MLMTTICGSYLVDFDEIFAPKWPCKDPLFESMNCGPLIQDIIHHPGRCGTFVYYTFAVSNAFVIKFIESFKIRHNLQGIATI